MATNAAATHIRHAEGHAVSSLPGAPARTGSRDTVTRRTRLVRSAVDIGFFSTVINLLLLISPLYMLQVYDRVLPAASLDTLLYLSLIAAGGLAVLGALEVVRSLYSNRVAAHLDKDLGAIAFMGALRGARAGQGDVQPLRDLATLRSFVSSRLLSFVFDLPFGPLFICLLYLVHPVLFFVTLGGAVAMVAIAVLNQLATSRLDKEAGDMLGASMSAAQAFARHAETVHALGMNGNAIEHWGDRFAGSLIAADRVSRINAYFSGASRTIRMLLQSAMLGAGAYLVLEGEMTAGMIFASSIISGRALQPLDQVVGSWRQIVEAGRAWKRLSLLIASVEAATPSDLTAAEPEGVLSMESVIYAPPNADPSAPPIIKRIGFTLTPGETVAVIGPSQSGKSTLCRLMVGAIAPRSGFVRLDGSDLRNWDPDRLGRVIGYLPQDVELFPGTIAQNISRFDPNPSEEAILEAARFAFAHEQIAGQKSGYQTMIAPNGVRLAGGERQRIGLARAFYGNPRVVVLDEPNSSLDAEGDAALERSIMAAKARGTAVVLITHRPSLVQRCDRIMTLRDGQIEFFGPASAALERVTRPVPRAGAKEPFASVAAAHPLQDGLNPTFSTRDKGEADTRRTPPALWSMRSSFVAAQTDRSAE